MTTTQTGTAATTGALAGVRVIDLTTLYPGPLATMLLGDLGAEVIRVDAPGRDDLLRWMPPHGPDGEGALYRRVGRNKRSLARDLQRPEGRDALLRLCETVDVLVEQFRPGVLDRLGLGWEALHARCPRLVVCSISAFGQDGPRAQRVGHDIGFLARAGLSAVLGRRGHGPLPLPTLVGDVGGGTWPAVTGILAALLHRGRTGRGQHVDISMTDGALLMNAMAANQALAAGEDAQPEGGWLDGGTFYDYYRTRDDRYLAVGALEPKFWSDFLRVIGRSELEPLYLAPGEEGARCKAAIAAAVVERDLADWTAAFEAVDCCVEPVLTPTEAVADPLFAARGMVVQVPAPDGSRAAQIGCPVRLSEAPPRYDRTGPSPGADTRAILAEAGLSEAEIAALLAAGVAEGR